MGKAHAIALRSVATVFPDAPAPVREILADVDGSRAEQHAKAWGFRHATDDWLSACLAPEVDVVGICTPNHLHKEMVLAAIGAMTALVTGCTIEVEREGGRGAANPPPPPDSP